jgi:peptidoglycan-associated lipoprotein
MHVRLVASLALAVLVSACATQEPAKPAPEPVQARPAPPAPQPVPPSAPVAKPEPAAPRTAPAMRSVYFDFDKSDIKPEFRALLEENAKYLRENPSLKVRIEGNCDERGSREYNIGLGQRRAEAVLRTLSLLGIDAKRMEAVSYGEEKPRRAEHNEAAWAENRRGDIQY